MNVGQPQKLKEVAGSVDRRPFVDAAFIIALGAIGILGFRTTYGGYLYLVIGVVALTLGVAISEITGRLRQPYFVEVFITVAAFFLLGGIVSLQNESAVGAIPSPSTLARIASVAIGGWKELLTIRPPVGNSSGLLVIPYLVGLFGGMSGYSIARRTRFTALPSIVPFAILIVGILFGTDQSAALLVQGSVFGGLVLIWLAIRGSRVRLSPTVSVSMARAATGLGIVVVAAVIAPFVGPSLPFAGMHQRVVLSRYVVPPLNSSDLASPLASFRDYTTGAPTSLAQTVLFIVGGIKPNSLLRIATMDSYNGLVWGFGNSSASVNGSQFYRYGSTIPAAVSGQQSLITVHIVHPIQAWLPDIGQPTRVTFMGKYASDLTAGFLFNPLTDTGVDAALGSGGTTYNMRVIVQSTPSSSVLAVAAAGSNQVDVIIPTPLQTQAQKWVGNTNGAWNKVLKIAADLKTQGRFSNGTENPPLSLPGHSAGRLTRFISGGPLVGTQIVGDDEQFAATLALMSNAVGVPARVVLGARVPAGGVIKGSDVHAWVEVALAGIGWVAVDSSRFLPTNVPTPVKQQNQALQAAQTPVSPPLASILHPPPAALPQSAGLSQFASDPNKLNTFQIPTIVITLAKFVGLPSLLGMLAAGSIGALKLRRRRRRRNLGSPAQRIAGGWRELIDLANDYKFGVGANLTRREQAAALAIVNAPTLALEADSLVFGPRQPTDEAVDRYWNEVDVSLRQLGSGVGRIQRIRAFLNISSLFGRRMGSL